MSCGTNLDGHRIAGAISENPLPFSGGKPAVYVKLRNDFKPYNSKSTGGKNTLLECFGKLSSNPRNHQWAQQKNASHGMPEHMFPRLTPRIRGMLRIIRNNMYITVSSCAAATSSNKFSRVNNKWQPDNKRRIIRATLNYRNIRRRNNIGETILTTLYVAATTPHKRKERKKDIK
ncbi:hypothetical protein EAG_08537 [Camponotus floridanus]|uniref:Uncharacterized protein n=1 Tax=Camponotus floridanus TaxID=104421 RepID=E2ANK5_CAMFO|nr:hypothetical protein EAG_08537 [Camponotus floridanus]